MSGAADPLVWLLPDVGEPARARARRVATFLRLLACDARGRPAESVGVGVGRVRAELERLGRERRAALTLALLRQHLAALVPPGSFLRPSPAPGDPARTLAEWVLELRLDGQEIPWRPEAGAACRARALLELLRAQLGADAPAARLFAAALEHALDGPHAGERAWLALERVPALRALAVEGVAAARLDRGRVRAARRWLAEAARTAPLGERARRLCAWAAAADGGPCEGLDGPDLPAVLAELLERRGARPASAPCAASARALAPESALARTGATVLVAFALAHGEARAVLWDVAPRWRGAFDAWCAARRRRHEEPGTDEERLLAGGAPLERERAANAPLAGALAATTRALALEPVRGADGRARGWLHLECPHGLLPLRAERSALARRLLPALEDAARRAPRAADPRARAARALAAALGAVAGRRRWRVFDEGGAEVAGGGGALGVGRPGAAGIVREVLASGRAAHLAGPDAARACHARATWGVALPLAHARRVHGVVCVEAERRASERAAARLAAAAQALGATWRAAAFARWHERRFGRAVAFPLEPDGWRAALARLALAARRGRALEILGEPGVGRAVVARWLHFEGPGPRAPLVALGRAGEAELVLRLASDEPLGVLLEGEALSPALRAAWRSRRRRERAASGPRSVLLVLGRPSAPPAFAPAGDVPGVRVLVPPLAERRDELPALLALLLRGRALTPRAEALLWRQPWPGNLPELAAFAAALAPTGAGERTPLPPIGERAVRAVAAARGLVLVERIPSRPPDRAALAAALRLARRPGRGSRNKRRAALLLGWDPATLARHAGAAGDPPAG